MGERMSGALLRSVSTRQIFKDIPAHGGKHGESRRSRRSASGPSKLTWRNWEIFLERFCRTSGSCWWFAWTECRLPMRVAWMSAVGVDFQGDEARAGIAAENEDEDAVAVEVPAGTFSGARR